MKIVVIDNYDSFTYNLVEYLHKLELEDVVVFRNDAVTVEQIEPYDRIILSPGPGLPNEVPLLQQIIETYKKTKPILGICLGHQAIAEAFGGRLRNSEKVAHGIATQARRTAVDRGCLHDLPERFQIGHYHSWYVAEDALPDCLQVTCYDEKGLIMGILHKEFAIEGIQFHPESVLTPLGLDMLQNWLKMT